MRSTFMRYRGILLTMAVVACQATPLGWVAPDAPSDASPDGPDPDAMSDRGLINLCGSIPVTLDDWENCYKKRWCEWAVGCRPMNKYRNVQECIDKSDLTESPSPVVARRERARAVAQGRSSLDVAAFTQCLIETSRAYCNTALSSVACANRFVGTVDDGGLCYTDIECASPGADCSANYTDACYQGTCQPKAQLGRTCSGLTGCEPGLQCHQQCLSGDVGASCASNRDCDPNVWCNAGVCTADLPEGASCTSPLQCGGTTSCIGLSVSSPDPGTCQTISHVGDACDYFCYGNLYCDATKVCRALPVIGEACSGSAPCAGVDAVCSNGQCVLRGSAATPCTSSQYCQPGLFCTSQLGEMPAVCSPPRDEGQPCTSATQCQSLLCSGASGNPGACLPWRDTCP